MDRAKQEQIAIERFIRIRNKAFIDAVMKDNWDGVKKYCETYKVPVPDDETIFKAGLYKAAYTVTGIPKEVRKVAREKLEALGFSVEMYGGGKAMETNFEKIKNSTYDGTHERFLQQIGG